MPYEVMLETDVTAHLYKYFAAVADVKLQNRLPQAVEINFYSE